MAEIHCSTLTADSILAQMSVFRESRALVTSGGNLSSSRVLLALAASDKGLAPPRLALAVEGTFLRICPN